MLPVPVIAARYVEGIEIVDEWYSGELNRSMLKFLMPLGIVIDSLSSDAGITSDTGVPEPGGVRV